jgi:hypothetical protein
MPIVVTVQEAEADLPGLPRRAEDAKKVRIVPIAKPDETPEERVAARRRFMGSLRGRVWMAPDVDEPSDDPSAVPKDDDSRLGDFGPDEHAR